VVYRKIIVVIIIVIIYTILIFNRKLEYIVIT
jgi:hypothetical protein